ncbi:4,5-DOPA dioxygenase extradiol [Lihuaxuella thermophila]|uniref:4,5-DOPA dioxygenase extradiol n=1 Tax=Lihuaxuella thermophila TaxID=1173111 RepID=A0A1H8H4M4_9BACL|nr:4,5-DOPA dioxygenase extradiol [Lihuaxuella thermophila]
MVPALFIGHGSPYLAVQQNEYSRFLHQLGQRFKPKAIAIFSAHWESETLSLTYTDDVLDTVYDYYGFPEEMYRVKYPAKGSVKIAEILEDRFDRYGIKTRREEKRGLDHGSHCGICIQTLTSLSFNYPSILSCHPRNSTILAGR